jgi:MerR family transcriptional regulator/heat shock protein HspR
VATSPGVFAISVVSEMVSMPAQNLRVYERHGLLQPERTPGGTRRYSEQDVERLHRIRDLLAEGLNLAGIAHVLCLEAEVERLEAERDRLQAEWDRLRGR